MSTEQHSHDPVTVEVVSSGLTEVCRHMANSLRRSAHSPLIHDASDFSCAMLDANMRLVAQQEGCPIHLGTLPLSVRIAVEEYGAENLSPGDVLTVNDPFRGGVHLNDIAFITPYFLEGAIIAYLACRAHWPDIGGIEPSGLTPDATHLIHEGTIIPPVRLRAGDVLCEDIIKIILENLRDPVGARGDLAAQIAAVDTGLERFGTLVSRHGVDTVIDTFQASLESGGRRMRAAIAAVPDGVYSFEDVMDDDGVEDWSITVKVTIRVAGESLKVDYTGTGTQALGPINSAYGMTRSSTFLILKALLDPLGPSNSGWQDMIEVEAPEGTLVNPTRNAAVFGGGIETSARIFDVVMGALAPVMPEKVLGAPYGTMDSSFISGVDPSGEPFFYDDWIPGGWGGAVDHDGVTCLVQLTANTDDIPIEICELKYPLRYHRSESIPDSGGPGRFRGGLGTIREIELLADEARASIQADRSRSEPWGVFGGLPGSRTRYSLVKADGTVEVVGGLDAQGGHRSAKRSFDMRRGDIMRIESAGGGGYGDPATRSPELAERDLRNGHVTAAAAEEHYGVTSHEGRTAS